MHFGAPRTCGSDTAILEGRQVAGERILVVDDEPSVVNVVRAYLEKEGYNVITARDGPSAWAVFQQEKPVLVVLDLMLPGISGEEICRRIRNAGETPVIMLTARSEETDKIIGLKLGADDYVTKPFSPRELVARVEAVLRRARAMTNGAAAGALSGGHEPPDGPTRIARGPLVIDAEQHQVWLDGVPVELTPTEFRLLETLARRPNRVFTRLELVERIQGEAYEGYERTIDSHVKNLRKKLRRKGCEANWIKTIFGVGYKFVEPS